MQTNADYQNRKKFCVKCNKYTHHTEVLCNESPPADTCCLCGLNHQENECSFKFCSRCAGNHGESQCKIRSVNELKCLLCDVVGHTAELCTNNWRLFHSVTSLSNLDKLSNPVYKSSRVVCPECGGNHHTFACSRFRNTLQNYNSSIKKESVEFISKNYLKLVDGMQVEKDDSDWKEDSNQSDVDTDFSESDTAEDDQSSSANVKSSNGMHVNKLYVNANHKQPSASNAFERKMASLIKRQKKKFCSILNATLIDNADHVDYRKPKVKSMNYKSNKFVKRPNEVVTYCEPRSTNDNHFTRLATNSKGKKPTISAANLAFFQVQDKYKKVNHFNSNLNYRNLYNRPNVNLNKNSNNNPNVNNTKSRRKELFDSLKDAKKQRRQQN